ncbi:MAG: LegC family aminotransferase [Thermodesulfovibrio sp.]|nr:LegC family aminotransferase [Thermodesulfovibrio sp.]MDW7998301.1 LegC family aminotransferase [Thermodesulfovibrio sp.]
MKKFEKILNFIKNIYGKQKIGLHEPVFLGKEKEYLIECLKSTKVSYIGEYVTEFEKKISEYTASSYAIAVVNATSGLHIALKVAGVNIDHEVITQPLTFVATANAISYCGAHPVFIDVDRDTLGMSPESLSNFLKKFATLKNGKLVNKKTKRRLSAVVPVHVFGHPCRIDEIVSIANEYGLLVIEDAAEALGSFYKGRHCGTFGKMAVISFNGNKIITTGGGGIILTNDKILADKIKHLTTTAKVPHPWEYYHDEIGFNYRMPNINSALGLAQMEYFDKILNDKRELASIYEKFFNEIQIPFIKEPQNSRSNYWLNGILMKNSKERDILLAYLNNEGVNARAAWRLLFRLKMYEKSFYTSCENAEWLADRIVNIPSSCRLNKLT